MSHGSLANLEELDVGATKQNMDAKNQYGMTRDVDDDFLLADNQMVDRYGDIGLIDQNIGEGADGRARRERTLTSKGLMHKQNTLRERRKKINGRLTRKYSTIEDLLFSTTNVLVVEEELNQLNDIFKMLLSVHEEYHSLLEDQEKAIEDEWLDEIDCKIYDFKRKIHCWLKDANKKKCGSIRSKGSMSSRRSKSTSRASSRSSKSSKEMEIRDKVELAQLVAEAEFLDEKQNIENQSQKLQIKEKLAKAKARVLAYQNGGSTQQLKDIHQQPDNTHSIYANRQQLHRGVQMEESRNTGKSYSNLERKNSAWDELDLQNKMNLGTTINRVQMPDSAEHNISKMVCKLLNQQAAPEIDIDVFDGNPVEFHHFMAVFNEVVEKRIDDEKGKLTRLIKYTKGEPKEMVKNCIQLPADVGFNCAKRLLQERYGDPHKIIAAYRQEIKLWPSIRPGDAESYFRCNAELFCIVR